MRHALFAATRARGRNNAGSVVEQRECVSNVGISDIARRITVALIPSPAKIFCQSCAQRNQGLVPSEQRGEGSMLAKPFHRLDKRSRSVKTRPKPEQSCISGITVPRRFFVGH